MNQDVINIIDTLHKAHNDNRRLFYYATEEQDKLGYSTMPVTPFIFELFIYNSLYQIDWDRTFEDDSLVFHAREAKETGEGNGSSETKQQIEFEKFLKQKSTSTMISEAFSPLLEKEFTGDWTTVAPDPRITLKQGEKFFEKLFDLRTMLYQFDQGIPLPKGKFFSRVKECRYFIYLVRNNVFHGTKTLGDVYEENQKKRIEIYETFISSITSLFFKVSRQIIECKM